MGRRAVGLCAGICALLVVVWGTISAASDVTRSPEAGLPAAPSAVAGVVGPPRRACSVHVVGEGRRL